MLYRYNRKLVRNMPQIHFPQRYELYGKKENNNIATPEMVETETLPKAVKRVKKTKTE